MKNSLSQKLNKFKTSPLIIGIAILEVILLICVSTFAWFVFADNNEISTDVISVEPDSGLEIDFNNAAENDYVNIWNYLEEFSFEPVTSLDGRNIFVPTTGTFNAIDTSKMTFREATVNDMNSKYICIDFTLTNTGEDDMPVYLSSQSYFKFNNSANGKALRLAFYQNDGSSGAITSSLLSKEYDGDTPEDPDDSEDSGSSSSSYLVYFDTTGSNWNDVWVEADFTSNAEGNTNKCLQMTKLDGDNNIYYINLLGLLESHGTNAFTFMKFRSNPNNTTNSTVSVELKNDNINPNTVYSFELKNGSAYEGQNSYGWGLMLNDPKPYDGKVPDIGGDDEGTGGTDDTTSDDSTTEGQTTVYFYNTLGWEQPYAYIWQENGNNDVPLSSWPGKPMTHISGNIYYYTFNSKYDSIIFNDGNSQGGAVKTGDISPVKDGYIYMIGSVNPDNSYGWNEENYNGSVEGGTYPVISPGVSTGFQRPYAPVLSINNNSGSASAIIPAFASSIDDYNYGSKELFTIKAGQTLPLSMIVWLEGTDPDCTADTYAGKSIDMNLVFATKDSSEEMYTYKFLDKTKENWIDDKITTDTGVSFNPVMQLYDVDNDKGYLMQLEEGSKTNWTCKAPEALVNSTHIMFRRVNPINEDEVWNYWDTYGFGSLPDKSGVVVDSTVYFSAFADGAPTNAAIDGAGSGTTGSGTTQTPADDGEYYLYGTINGTPCDANTKAYKFVDGKLTITFTQDSYIAVRDGSNYDCYGPKDYSTDTNVTLYKTGDGGSNTVYVPGGKELELTIANNGNGTLTLSYKEAGSTGNESVTPTPGTGSANANAPARSCGGLWGNHETQIVTVYDGTEGQWIKNSDISGTEAALTMNYTYNGQTVEYKASGSGRDMYYFVVPMQVYSKTNGARPTITFKRYYNYNNQYALNSDKNQLTYHMSWTNGTCNGKFAEITGNSSGNMYWGSDVLYVQAKEAVTSKMDNAYLQVHFYTTTDGSDESGTSTYVPLYKNNNYKSDVDNGYGYVAVIPSDRQYTYYRVERCDPKDHNNKWNITPLQGISHDVTTNNAHSNTVGPNICSIENLFLNIYLEVPNTMSNKDWCPEYYIWKDSTGATEKAWPGNSMTFVQASSASGNSTINLFKCYVNISKYDRILFSNEYDGTNRNYGGNNILGTDTDYNGMVYRAGGSYPNSLTIALQTDGRIGPGEVKNETLHVELYEAEGWEKNGN